MLIDAMFDRLVGRLRRSRRQQDDKISPTRGRMKTGFKGPLELNPNRRDSGGVFNGANNFVVNQPTFIERPQIIQNFAEGKPGLDPVLERIASYANLDAAMDSSARFPPPLCHPGTRLKIGSWLFNWLVDPKREWDMIWLRGPAGTGKSAVAQTFAERCAENGRLGASFFFSRPNDRNDPDTVIPSIVYQLAISLPQYKSLVAAQLTQDPELLRKTRRTQFRQLIIEPFSSLHMQEPLLIILDGLDECKGENPQREIVEMISEVIRLKHGLPLVWLVCSRPEAHLKYLFSRADFTVNCGREELLIDAESIADVDLYLRDGLGGIKLDFRDITAPTWPPENQVAELSSKASGHFAFASTALRYIGDLAFADPMARLDALLSFLEGVQIESSNPLEALDVLFSRILREVLKELLPIVKRLLGFLIYVRVGSSLGSTQSLCTFFHLDQTTFYRTFRKLHSVIDVPPPETTSELRIRFYHASFEDYIRDPRRSDEFAITKQDTVPEFAKLCLSWYKTDLSLFHTTDGSEFDAAHKHEILPDLSWVSDYNRVEVSRAVAVEAETWCWWACQGSEIWDEVLLSQIYYFDFRYIRTDELDDNWCDFVNKLWTLNSSSGIIRMEPRGEVDLRLVEYMKSMVEPALSSRPATFPIELSTSGGEYFLLGHDSQAIVCWTTGRGGDPKFSILNCNEAPSRERINAYQAWVVEDEDDSYDSDEEDEIERSGN